MTTMMMMMMMIRKSEPVNPPDSKRPSPNKSRRNLSSRSKIRARLTNLAVTATKSKHMVLHISGTTTDATRIVATIRTAITMIVTTGTTGTTATTVTTGTTGTTGEETAKTEATKVASTSGTTTSVVIGTRVVATTGKDANLVPRRNRSMKTQTTGYTTATTPNSSSR